MKFKVFSTVVFLCFIVNVNAILSSNKFVNAGSTKFEVINTDSFLHAVLHDSISPIKVSKPRLKNTNPTRKAFYNKVKLPRNETTINIIKSLHIDSALHVPTPTVIKTEKVDSLLLLANPLLIELVYTGLPFDFNWDNEDDFRTLYYGRQASTLTEGGFKPIDIPSAEQIIDELRRDARDNISRKAVYLYVTRFDELPDPEGIKSRYINDKKLTKVKFIDDKDELYRYRQRLIVKREKIGPWQHKANALAQFSESVISENWYQGGNSNIAILGIMTAQLNYDNKKDIQWENCAEWRIGFNSVAGDTLRMLSTNDDVVKINSKLGIKAGGNFFYSGSVDFSTQLFNSYNGINSTIMKTSFLTPVRLNIGVGLDYKYKKIFSLMLAPIAFKYIYVSDNSNVNPNLFGIKTGKNNLNEIGSSFKAILSYPLSREIQFDSRLSLYTNYQKVEIDWEMVCNLTINRFMSTRISFNPRYDNTVIETNGSKAKMQLKQLLSVGFSHKFN